MTLPPAPTTLRTALEAIGQASELALPGGDAVLARWDSGLADFIAAYQSRYGERVDPFAWWSGNTFKAKAFFDPDTLRLSTRSKVAVWRILLGSSVVAIDLSLRPDSERFRLAITLSTPYGEEETHESDDPNDFRLFRHLGMVQVDGRPEVQGYFALRR